MKHITSIAAILLLSACSANMDMHGTDPYEYYTEHPIKNTFETRHLDVETHFAPSAVKLSNEEMDALRSGLHAVSPEAVDTMVAELSAADMKNTVRRDALSRSLRALGYKEHALTFTKAGDLERDDVRLHVAYLQIVPPDCPDWRTSPVTTYSNTHQGNFDCANEVDVGLMVADPHDLVRGPGSNFIDTERAAKAIQNYQTGTVSTVPAGTSTSTTSTGGSPTTTAAPTPQ